MQQNEIWINPTLQYQEAHAFKIPSIMLVVCGNPSSYCHLQLIACMNCGKQFVFYKPDTLTLSCTMSACEDRYK